MKHKPKTSLWRIRKAKGLSQKSLSYLMDISPYQISRYEAGLTTPTLRSALRLQAILGVPLSNLFAELYNAAIEQARIKVKASPKNFADFELGRSDHCSFEDLLNDRTFSDEASLKVRDHTQQLIARHGEYLRAERLRAEEGGKNDAT